MKRKLYLGIVFLMILNTKGYSEEIKQVEPSFNFTSFRPPVGKECIRSNKEDDYLFLNYSTCISPEDAYFARNLKMKKEDLEDIFNKLIIYEMDDFIITKKNIKGYDIISYESKLPQNIISISKYLTIGKATYILKNNIVIGYQILGPVNISKYNNKDYTDPKISIIKSFKTKNKLSTKDVKISLYSKNKNDFIETFCIVDLANASNQDYKSFLYLDSFYPEKLKKELNPILKDSLKYTFGITKFDDLDDNEKKED
ncbi:MAG: hypothetical protein U0457_19905 [Candidatus Sericytochromatia bacterium]